MREQRRAPRFPMHLPLKLVRVGSDPQTMSTETKNMSSLGVLFSAEEPLHVGETVEYIITLPGTSPGVDGVRLRCLGKVVRNEPARNGSHPPTVAATLERYEFVREGAER